MPRGRKSKKKQEQKKLNITVAILIVLSILLAVLIYTKSGYLGQTLSPALGGVLGYIKYLVPIALFAFSLYIAYDKDKKYYTAYALVHGDSSRQPTKTEYKSRIQQEEELEDALNAFIRQNCGKNEE